MAQAFWASTGFDLLGHEREGLVATDAWLAGFLERSELKPPVDAGAHELALHALIAANARASVAPAMLAAVEDGDARQNWREFLRFRDRVVAAPTLEEAYRGLFAADAVDLSPTFVDVLAQAITRSILDGTEDPWLCRAGEMLFRRQRVSTEGGQVLAADAMTLEAFAETGGFGAVGRLLRKQSTAMPEVKMDVLNHENAPFYFLRDELYSFALDLTPGREGAGALARVLAGWVRRLAGAEGTIEPLERIQDDCLPLDPGLRLRATLVLDALLPGGNVAAAQLERMVLLFRVEFRHPRGAAPEIGPRPRHLGPSGRPDRTPQLK